MNEIEKYKAVYQEGSTPKDNPFIQALPKQLTAQRFALAQQGLRSGGVRAAAGGQHPAQQYAAPGPGQRGFRRGVRLFQLPRRVIHTV